MLIAHAIRAILCHVVFIFHLILAFSKILLAFELSKMFVNFSFVFGSSRFRLVQLAQSVANWLILN